MDQSLGLITNKKSDCLKHKWGNMFRFLEVCTVCSRLPIRAYVPCQNAVVSALVVYSLLRPDDSCSSATNILTQRTFAVCILQIVKATVKVCSSHSL